MKKLVFVSTCLLIICGLQAMAADSTYQVSGGGKTAELDKKYQVTATVFRTRAGHTLKFTSDVAFSKAIMKVWTKNGQGNSVSTSHTTNFNTPVQTYNFNLDSPAYKGGLQYDLLLYLNANDSESQYTWRIHLYKNP